MQARQLIATAIVPGTTDELRLFRRGGDFMIVVGRDQLMSSRMSGSEEALGGRAEPWLLTGGYGMGFTLRAALRVLPADAQPVVAELVPDIIAWARGPMVDLTAGCLEDSRVRVAERRRRLYRRGTGRVRRHIARCR